MTLYERVLAYSEAFPNYPSIWQDRGWLMGVWVMGNSYKKANGYYGAFPGNFLKRVLAIFPDRKRTLHLFSGTLIAGPNETTVDCQISDLVRPTVVADARNLPFSDASFDFLLADPPYSSKDSENYGTPMVSRRHIIMEAARVTKVGGHLAWLDVQRPIYRKAQWKQIGAIMVLVSTNCRARCLSLFERQS